MSALTDESLLKRWCERRDAEAFREIAARYAAMVYATCKRILGNATEAEDVTQECFETLAQVDKGPKKHLGAWLHAVATNCSLNRLRAEKRRRDREARFASSHETGAGAEWEEIYGYVDEAIEHLPEELRIPVVAHFLENQSHAAIAQALGVSPRTVGYRIEKAIELIRNALKKRGVQVATTALATMMAANLAEAAPITASLTAAMGKLALAGTAGGTAPGAASQLAVYGGIVVMTKKVLIAVGMLAVVLGGSYLLVAPKRGSVPERETVDRAAIGERGLTPSRGEVEEKAPGTEGREAADSAKRHSELARHAGAERVEPESDILAPWLEKLMDAAKQNRERQEEDELEPVRSSDVPPENGAHYFLIAAELFPDVDREWLQEKLEELRSTGVMDDPELLAFLAACQESFDAVRQGLAVGNAELPPARHGPEEPLPYLTAYRSMADAMRIEAEMLAAQGDYQGAFAMYDTLMDFGTESARGGPVMNGLVANNVESVAMESLRYAMKSGWVTPDDYRFLIEQLYEADARQYRTWEGTMAEAQNLALWVDRMTQEGDTVFAEAFEKVCSDAEGLQDALSGMTPAEMESLCRQMLTDYERVAAYLELPYYEAQRIDADSLLGDNPIIQAFLDRTPRLNVVEARSAAFVRGTLVMAAVELYRAEHATYPATLTQLVPDYLQVLPQDPFTGGTFGYAVGENDYLLYSFAQDMKDDGGITFDQTGSFWTWQGDQVIHGENVSIR
jgi:RNA polymerase sigma factor (sigma-70 family)